MIRQQVFNRDQGFCRSCGVYDEYWQADHILPVFMGGSARGLDNFQTLCLDCHKSKTYSFAHHKAISSHAASTRFIRRTYDFGDSSCMELKTSCDKHILKLGFSPSCAI